MGCERAIDSQHPGHNDLGCAVRGARTGRGWGFVAAIILLSAASPNLILHGAAGSEPEPHGTARAVISCPLVVTQIPVGGQRETHSAHSASLLRMPYHDGARILLVPPSSSARVLTPGFQSAADPNISFDGKRMLFAGRRTVADGWAIYETTIGTGAVRQITRTAGDCRSPSYQGSMYTITEDAPWHQITFVHSEAGVVNEFGTAPARAIWSCKLDGSFAQRLTYNLSSDFDPAILPDGRIVFAAWQRASFEHGLAGRVALMGVNIDGIDLATLCGNPGRRIQHMPCVTAGGLVVFVEADSAPWDGAGMLSCVSLRRPLHSYHQITTQSDGLFHSPSGLPDGRILVSRRPADGSSPHAVYCLDPISKRLEPVFADSRFHCVQAQAVAPRPEPDGRSSVLTPEEPLGKLYCLDVYKTDLKDLSWFPRGAAKKVRVLEGIPRKAAGGDAPSPAQSLPDVPQLASRRILGEAPVAADGSFNVEVPANTPIQLQLLDERGLALRSCGWIWTRNHEPQGCIGCHEDPELTPANLLVDALTMEPVSVAVPLHKRQTVDFRRDVMPILARKCAPCHAAAGSARRDVPEPVMDADAESLSQNRVVAQPPPAVLGSSAQPRAAVPRYGMGFSAKGLYETFLARAPASSDRPLNWKYVEPGKARTSPLVWHVCGINTSRPWDGGAAARPAKPIPPDKSPPLSPEEKALLIRWIDLGATWEGIAASANLRREVD